MKIFDSGYRGDCPAETLEQMTVIAYIRKRCPVVIHPRNEGQRSHRQTIRHKAEGLTTGASDIIIPGSPAFVCELKRKDRTQSKVSKAQLAYLIECEKLGAFCCIAYGHEEAIKAFHEWLDLVSNSRKR